MTVMEMTSVKAEEAITIALSDEEKTKILTLAANGALISAGQFHVRDAGMMDDLGESIERFLASDQDCTVGQLSDAQGELYHSIRTPSEDMLSFFNDASIKQAQKLIDESPESLPVLSQELTLEELLQVIAAQNPPPEKDLDHQSAAFFSELDSFVQVVTPI